MGLAPSLLLFQWASAVGATAPDRGGLVRADLVADTAGTEARWVKAEARNFGTIPDWHHGRGDDAYVFVDEIIIE